MNSVLYFVGAVVIIAVVGRSLLGRLRHGTDFQTRSILGQRYAECR